MNSEELRALVVEDDPSWQQILQEILEDRGMVVDVAGNIETALDAIRDHSHRLAVVDLSLSKTDHSNSDGLRLLEELRRSDPGCRTILLTGFATVELAVSVLTEYGAFTFLRKENFNRAQFRDLINKVLASSNPTRAGEPTAETTSTLKYETGTPEVAGKESILVVEDDAGWRSIFSELLSDLGHPTRLCASFGDALGCLHRDTYTLAIIDLSLTHSTTWKDTVLDEKLEGVQLLAESKALGIPAIVVSGIASVDEIRQAYSQYSIFAYLEKQAFDRATFLTLVEQALRSSRSLEKLGGLTGREREVFELMSNGMTNKEIAQTLVITTNTVKRHLKSIFEKLDVHTRSAAIARAAGNQPQS